MKNTHSRDFQSQILRDVFNYVGYGAGLVDCVCDDICLLPRLELFDMVRRGGKEEGVKGRGKKWGLPK
jgi:hypothetical protein